MKLIKFLSCIVAFYCLLFVSDASAQSTFSLVRQILQTNCSGVSCHGSGLNSFTVSGTEAALYSALVNKTPQNPAAAARGDKLVMPGYADRSFLLRKIAHGISAPLALRPQEGADMPKNAPKLPDNQIELVRQWILYGAPQTGSVADTAIINSYYRGAGIDDTYPQHDPPPAGEGFQIYIGRIFMAPDTEAYYYIKHDPLLTENIEIPKVVTMLPLATHHFVIYKFFPGGSAGYREGLRLENESSHANVSDGIGTGEGMWTYELPAGTAYFWEAGTILDFNLHIFNYHDSVMSFDLYINIYTQPLGTAHDYMLIRNFPVDTIVIPQDGQVHTYTAVASDSQETRMWRIWQLYSHTHKYGKDYDIYLRKPDGTKGEKVYEGMYSYEDNYYVGFYRTGVDATFRYFPDDALLEVDPRLGFIHEAQWLNTDGPDPITWGLTSADEMMVMGFQYVKGDLLTAVAGQKEVVSNVRIFPNPSAGEFTVTFAVKSATLVEIELTGMMGETIAALFNETLSAGSHSLKLNTRDYHLPEGIYFVRTTIGGSTSNHKLIVMGK